MSLNLISGKSKRQTIEGVGGIGQIYPRNASPPSMCPRVGACYISHTYPFNPFLSNTVYRKKEKNLHHILLRLNINFTFCIITEQFCSTVFVCLQLYEHISSKKFNPFNGRLLLTVIVCLDYFRLARTCTEDCEINGVPFRKGWVVRIMLCTVYSDDSFFPKPEVFDSDRYGNNDTLLL